MKALIVNASCEMTEAGRSREFYNLGAAKLAGYLVDQGYEVTRAAGDPGMFVLGYDLVCVSIIFSWHVETAVAVAQRATQAGAEVWAGGPGLYALRAWFEDKTGIKPSWKPDPRFDKQRGSYKMIYSVRGCAGEEGYGPCEWCNVPKIEGTRYLYDPGFQPAPFLLDNNLSGTPVPIQERIIAKYQAGDVPLLDANSGFEPGAFDAGTFARWDPILRGPWRFAFDHSREEAAVRRTAALLADVPAKRKRVYAMCGNEPIEVCYERTMKVVEMGCEPHVQFRVPLNALDKSDSTRWTEPPEFGWTTSLGRDFMRYWNSFLYRNLPQNTPRALTVSGPSHFSGAKYDRPFPRTPRE